MSELSCAEANKFLAEDRIMCLEIFIKQNCSYYLTYVPDAKAFTDAPGSLAVLIKQRRRWMNGSLFGTYHVIKNTVHVLSCNRTRHGRCFKCGFSFFMIYYILSFTLSFFILGAMYTVITVFFQDYLSKLIEAILGEDNEELIVEITGYVNAFLNYFYIALAFCSVVVSLTRPVERGIWMFKVVMIIFGICMYVTLGGILYFLISTGFYPEILYYQRYSKWSHTGLHNFSYLVLAGTIMMVVFIAPFLLRPMDAMQNLWRYVVGLFSYLFLMPTFINIMQIYAFCNLHDISWGNRPATS